MLAPLRSFSGSLSLIKRDIRPHGEQWTRFVVPAPHHWLVSPCWGPFVGLSGPIYSACSVNDGCSQTAVPFLFSLSERGNVDPRVTGFIKGSISVVWVQKTQKSPVAVRLNSECVSFRLFRPTLCLVSHHQYISADH